MRAKTRRLKKETGNPDLYCSLDEEGMSDQTRFKHAIVRPLTMLVTLPPIFILALYVAVVYGVLYLLFSTFTFVFSEQYGFSSGVIGLSYVPTGIGMLLGVMTFGALTDVIIKKKIAKGETPEPEDRLPMALTVPSGVAISAALFWYGWSIESNTHWIVPMIGEALFCFGLMGVMVRNPCTTLFSILTLAADVRPNLSRRLLYKICRIGDCGYHGTQVASWSVTSTGRSVHVQFSWPRMGKQRAGIHIFGSGTGTRRVPVLWQEDTCEVPSQIVGTH